MRQQVPVEASGPEFRGFMPALCLNKQHWLPALIVRDEIDFFAW
jgi:hypothetical protein